MKLLSRNTDYAMRAVCYIAKKNPGVVSVTELVEKLKIPRPFLRKILQVLNNEGMLRSYKGNGGGFMLGRAAGRIYLLEVAEVFQGTFSLNECTFKKDICPNKKKCFLKRKIDSIERHVYSELKSITIDSILKQ